VVSFECSLKLRSFVNTLAGTCVVMLPTHSLNMTYLCLPQSTVFTARIMRVQRLVIFESDHEALRGSNLKPPQANQSSYLLQDDGEDDDVCVTACCLERDCRRTAMLRACFHFQWTLILCHVHTEQKSKQSSPATRHGGAWGERRYIFYSLLTSALDGGEWSASRPGRALPRGKDPRYPLYRGLGGPQSRSGHRG
jgi:hypothetical protein